MKKFFKKVFGLLLSLIRNAIYFLFYIIAFPFAFLFVKGKTKGKENLNKDDEARIFVANHYEVYGPFITYLKFPYSFRPWIIDKMIDPKTVEAHMSIGIYNQFPKFPKWVKFIFIKVSKSLMVFFMKTIARGIPVSRDDFRKNIKTMQISTETLESGEPILIFPEAKAVKEGVGEFMTGFEHIAKYYYQKTGKKVSFYPMFISKTNQTMYIGKPVIFNPENDAKIEKERIISTLKDRMLDSYIQYECGKPSKKAKKL